MKAIITGSEGFVGKYLQAELKNNGYDVVRIDLIDLPNVIKIDITDAEVVKEVVFNEQPDVIFHLAGQANVAKSWEQPQNTIKLNVVGAVNILEAVRACEKKIKVVVIGSSDEYGKLKEKGENVTEETRTSPENPYSISKVMQELFSQLYYKVYGIDVVLTRSFNHGGAGQRKGFLISDFCSGIVCIERKKEKVLRVGNLEAARDFTHVKDVVRAYRLLAEKGIAGEVYNVGSGKCYTAKEVLDKAISFSDEKIIIELDKNKLRPSDTPIIKCNNTKLKKDTGWEPKEDIDTIIKDTLEFYRSI